MPKDQGNEFAEPLEQAGRTEILWRGRTLAYFAGCDYFRLSSSPAILKSIRAALISNGLNVAASRKTTGNHRLYALLEKEAARFFKSESACLVSNGYLTNIIAAQALEGNFDLVYVDERAHPSLKHATKFLECPAVSFSHRKPEDLQSQIVKVPNKARIAILTDGMFAQTGSLAPLAAYRAVAGPDALLWVDDSHAGGILGPNGRGTFEAAGLTRRNLLQTITFSKAFGVYGGAILSNRTLNRRIVAGSQALAGNTPLPLPLAAGALASLKWVARHPDLRKKLRRNVESFWKESKLEPPGHLSPIISFTAPQPSRFRKRLLERGVFPSFIRYPGGPAEGYFRFAISSAHHLQQIRALAEAAAGAEVAPVR